MTGLRLLLIAIFGVLAVYTAFVVAEHGLGLVPIFFGDMAAMTWPGQFNLDFFCFLILSAVWTAWRNRFSPAGLGLSVLALTGGSLFLSVYLLYLSFATGGDIRAMLLGPERAAVKAH